MGVGGGGEGMTAMFDIAFAELECCRRVLFVFASTSSTPPPVSPPLALGLLWYDGHDQDSKAGEDSQKWSGNLCSIYYMESAVQLGVEVMWRRRHPWTNQNQARRAGSEYIYNIIIYIYIHNAYLPNNDSVLVLL